MILALFWMSTATAAPLPIPLAAIGSNRPFTLHSHDYSLNGGGAFQGSIATDEAWLWCVDIDHSATWNSYLANITLLDNTWAGGANSEVQKGDASTAFTLASLSGTIAGLPFAFSPTNEQRYQAAAYLISQMTYYATGGASADFAHDQPFQNSAWALLDAGSANLNMSPAEAALALAALKAVIVDQPTFGYGQWAVVSGATPIGGTLLNVSTPAYQTFLTPVQGIPEPASFAMLAGGLCALALLSKAPRPRSGPRPRHLSQPRCRVRGFAATPAASPSSTPAAQ